MKIKKGTTVLNVTRGAFQSLFKPYGWKEYKGSTSKKPVGNTHFMNPQPTKEHSEIEVSDVPFGNIMTEQVQPEEFESDEEFEIVLDDMTVKELVAYAEENGIDLGGATRKSSIIHIINEVMKEE